MIQTKRVDPLIFKQVLKALILIGLLSTLVVFSGIFFEAQLILIAQGVTDHIGFFGMCLLLFITDTFVTPFPPDILLVIIAKSDLNSRWPIYVLVLGIISTLSGLTGWSIGRRLGHFSWAQKIFGNLKTEQRDFIKKNGVFAVVLGALTPIPFSLTCWTAGILNISFSSTAYAALLRIPRFFIYYLLIEYSASVSEVFKMSGWSLN